MNNFAPPRMHRQRWIPRSANISGYRRRPCPIIVALAALVLVGVSPVAAQLTQDDIAALRHQGEIEGWTFTVGENGATAFALEDLCGLVVPENWQAEAPFVTMTPSRDLPESFDWRELGGCTPIKSQGGCGSCWAFGTVGALECNIKIRDSVTVDLSEQWLVSCNSDDWGCDGGWFAHKYHQWKKDPCYQTGAVLESEFPYRASDLPCGCPYSHPYLIQGYAFIAGEHSVPSVEAIKQAIMTYGPVSVAVVSTAAMHAYTGGVFNQNMSGAINHAVVLVGWDDTQGTEGIWIMRNSWGAWWGEGGYMRIEYGCCHIGYAASYVDYPGAVRIVTADLPACSVGVYYARQLVSFGGIGAISWTDRDGDLAGTGLSLSPDGLLSGIPTAESDIAFVAVVEDAVGGSAVRSFTITTNRYLDGDANADAQVNLGDAVYIINYVFKDGPGPYPLEASGDANCDDAVNIADGVYIIAYIFKDGSAPVCP